MNAKYIYTLAVQGQFCHEKGFNYYSYPQVQSMTVWFTLQLSSRQCHHLPLKVVNKQVSMITTLEIRTFIRFALLSKLPSSLDRSFTPMFFEILITHDFTANEFIFEVRATRLCKARIKGEKYGILDDTRSLWGFCSLSDCPCTDLIWTTGEIPNKLLIGC